MADYITRRLCKHWDQFLPERLDKSGRRISWHFAGLVGVHASQELNGVEYVYCSRRGPQLEHGEKFQRITTPCCVPLADAV